jgi:hypothetical protein
MSTSPYVYVLIRRDIPIEHQLTQACHAALEIGLRCKNTGVISSLITLAVPDARYLLEWKKKLDLEGVLHHLFYEPDVHADGPMGWTALATEPLCGEVRNMFKKLPLWSNM